MKYYLLDSIPLWRIILKIYVCILDVVTPGSADSSGDYFALHHDSGTWTIKEYGTKEKAFSLCQFISTTALFIPSLKKN